jgi:kynureninase
MSSTVGDQVGRIVGAPPGSTVMHQNVAVAEAVVRSCFRPGGARNRVVYEEGNFPSVRYLYQAQPDLKIRGAD